MCELVTERKAAAKAEATRRASGRSLYSDLEHGGGKGAGKGQAGTNELPSPVNVVMPADMECVGFLCICDGHLLKETASVSRVVLGTRRQRCGNTAMPLFISSHVSV